MYTDNAASTGWWEEGAGLVRGGSHITQVPARAWIAPLAVAAPAYASGAIHARGTTAEGLWADEGIVTPRATIALAENHTTAMLRWTLALLANGVEVASGNVSASLTAGTHDVAGPSISIAAAELWSVARPALYTLQTDLIVDGATVDSVLDTIGVRNLAWDADEGLHVNGEHVKMRGVCNHETMGGVGAAIPPRVDLLRVQQLRGVGGNAWRASHNPPEPQLLFLADRLGVLVLDEGRVFATISNVGECGAGGCRDLPVAPGADPVAEGALLARRDRLHASVAFFSVCNELGCGPATLLLNDLALAIFQAIDAVDGSRAITANMGWQGRNATAPLTPISFALDVFGMSHQSTATLNTFHATMPYKPLVMSECCSCETQRGEDADLPRSPNSSVYYSSENSACLAAQTQVSDAPAFCAGTFIWTLHDYGGEPDLYPHVSSSFGSIDFASFHKPASAWLRAWWLSAIPLDDAGRPPLPHTGTTCKLVESWRDSPNGTRTLHVYTNAPQARLVINGGAPSAPVMVSPFGMATFNVPYTPGSVAAQALSADGATILALDSAESWGTPASIVLSLDAPSPLTGTGAALFLDGSDVALVRATVVDAAGRTCHDAVVDISFTVVSGPGLVVGVANGDPADASVTIATRASYHGLVRAIVRVTLDAAGDVGARALRAAVNVDAGVGPGSSAVWTGAVPPPLTPITVSASAAGLASGSISVAVSVDPRDAVLAVAAASVGLADTGSA